MVPFLSKTFLHSRQSLGYARKSLIAQQNIPCHSKMAVTWLKSTKLGRCISTTRAVQSSDIQSKADMEKAMNEIEDLFGVAKDEMEYAEESHGSVYYQEDHVTAKKAVEECLDAYDNFLKDLPSDDMRKEVQGKVGMKLKELKMAFEALPMDDH